MIGDIVIASLLALGALWIALIVWAVVRRPSAAAIRDAARLLPDTLRLLRRVADDPESPRLLKMRLWLTIGYLASPIDLIPDFLPGIGQADDVLVIALAIRAMVRHIGSERIRQQWPGTADGLVMLRRLCRLG